MGEIRLGEMGLGEMGLGEMGQNQQTYVHSRIPTDKTEEVPKELTVETRRETKIII